MIDDGMHPTPLAPLTRAESDLLAKRRRGRNIAMLVVLGGIAVLFYAIAMVKLNLGGTPH
jgi:hypothetical protein